MDVGDLGVSVGAAARDTFCRELQSAQLSIEIELYRLDDPAVEDAIKKALLKTPSLQVSIYVEGNRHRYGPKARSVAGLASASERANRSARTIAVRLMREFPRASIKVDGGDSSLVHAKAAVIDGREALVASANLDRSGIESPGQICIADRLPADVQLVSAAIEGSGAVHHGKDAADPTHGDRIVAGPEPATRVRIEAMLDSRHDMRIAMEDLSDAEVVQKLIERNSARGGHHDRIILGDDCRRSGWAARELDALWAANVAVRVVSTGYFHEKYIDTGDSIFVGSHNLTQNGLDEAREIGILAPAGDFGSGGQALRDDFDRRWDSLGPPSS